MSLIHALKVPGHLFLVVVLMAPLFTSCVKPPKNATYYVDSQKVPHPPIEVGEIPEAPVPNPAPKRKPEKKKRDGGRDVFQEGLASWYGAQFHGKATASGERFNMHALTAAHKTLPFGTVLRVTCEETGKSVDVRVNDRGPHAKARILDVSYAAAKRLEMVNRGTSRISMQIVSMPN